MMKAVPAPICKYCVGITSPMYLPKRTPISVVVISANEAPRNTTNGYSLLCAAISMVASCVLSPNSAKNHPKG